nr:MAG TPA: hypothetical protein [Caudoviricetes sp.]
MVLIVTAQQQRIKASCAWRLHFLPANMGWLVSALSIHAMTFVILSLATEQKLIMRLLIYPKRNSIP